MYYKYSNNRQKKKVKKDKYIFSISIKDNGNIELRKKRRVDGGMVDAAHSKCADVIS